MNEVFLQKAISEAIKTLRRNMIKYHKSFPNQCATGGIYGADKGFWADWHPGLYVGLYWLSYELSGDIKFRKYAESMEDILYNMLSDGNIWHSDMGTVYLPCVLYDIYYNKSEAAKQIIVAAADCLAEKMAHGGRFADITYFAPNAHRARRDYYITQVTFLCNIQLFTLAAEITGNNKYISLAEGSLESVFKYNIKDDGDVLFRLSLNKDDLMVRVSASRDDMMTAQDKYRGFAWAIWALADCYNTQKNEIFLQKFELVADFLEKNYYSKLLYRPNNEALGQYYDSSASAIALCGFLEIAESPGVEEKRRERSLSMAKNLFEDIFKNSLCLSSDGDECLIENGYKFYTNQGYLPKTSGTIPGDYFWLKSLLKFKKIMEKQIIV